MFKNPEMLRKQARNWNEEISDFGCAIQSWRNRTNVDVVALRISIFVVINFICRNSIRVLQCFLYFNALFWDNVTESERALPGGLVCFFAGKEIEGCAFANDFCFRVAKLLFKLVIFNSTEKTCRTNLSETCTIGNPSSLAFARR